MRQKADAGRGSGSVSSRDRRRGACGPWRGIPDRFAILIEGSSLVVIGLACAAACTSVGSVPPATPRKLTRVNVTVYASGDTGGVVEAVLIDRDGRRTGWTLKGELKEIMGCINQSGWEDGIPNPRPDETDTAAARAWESTQVPPGEPEPLPTHHHFAIGDSYYPWIDPTRFARLIDQGGGELWLNPISARRVRLAINAEGIGVRGCRDTTSALIVPREPMRWRLSWKVAGDSCIVKISLLEEQGSARPRER
jgi:hypothetical protein